MRWCLILFLLMTPACSGQSWLNEVTEKYNQIKLDIRAPEAAKKLVDLPINMPKDWHYQYINEPVFNSKIAVLQAGKAHKHSIVLVHGLGQLAMQDWYDVIPELAKKYHVIALDLPRFGYSEQPKGRYSPTQYAQVVKAVVDQFSQQHLFVMGHAMGGLLHCALQPCIPID